MKYRVLDPNLTAVSRGEFHVTVEDGLIELPDDLARELFAIGTIAPIAEPQETKDDGLRHLERRQNRARKQRNN